MRLKRRPKLSAQDVLGAHPVRNSQVEWEESEDGEVLIVIKPRKDRVPKWLSWIVPAPPEKRISLDEVGSEVWRLCDGKATVEQIVRKLGKRYKLNRREAEASTTEYLRRLGKRKLVGFLIPKRKA